MKETVTAGIKAISEVVQMTITLPSAIPLIDLCSSRLLKRKLLLNTTAAALVIFMGMPFCPPGILMFSLKVFTKTHQILVIFSDHN